MSEGNIKVLNLNDIVDHMRMIRLVEKEETLVLDEEYSSIFDGTLDKMMENVEAKDIQE